ncbi:MAG: DUF362 domain-containing protein [Anaerolineae bacterium]
MSPQTNNEHRIYIDEIRDDRKSALRSGLEFIHWHKYIDNNSRVFVKPNFTFPRYSEGVTTSPELLKCLLELLKARAGTVVVGESDGGNNSFKAEEAFTGHNMYQICKEMGAEVVNLSTLPSEIIESRILGKTVKVQLPKLLLEDIDCFISVPVLKVHVMTTISLSLKNSWGCVPDTMRGMHHQNLPYKLALIAKLLKPRIIVVDGTYALDGHGPMYGEPVKRDLVLIADNTVAADALGARLMGFSPQRIKHIAVAEKAGLGSTRIEDMEISQDWQQYRRRCHIERTLIDRISALPFNSDTLAKLIFQSQFTPLIYKVVGVLRTSKEREIASQLGKRKKFGPYW